MTHKDIYTKFMIEYDKANVTSSYPSLTEYEVATLLDKAYLALIAQKLTGNNLRRMPFEGDNKAIADIEPLLTHREISLYNSEHQPSINVTQFKLPIDHMYFIQAQLEQVMQGTTADGIQTRILPVNLVTHKIAERFFVTPYNMPWVKNPVCYIEGGVCYVVYDPMNKPSVNAGDHAHLTYLKKPVAFSRSTIMDDSYFLEVDVYNFNDPGFYDMDPNEILNENEVYQGSTDERGLRTSDVYGDPSTTMVSISEDNQAFELSDTMAEELINLAITFALENVESPRLSTKLNTRGLEA